MCHASARSRRRHSWTGATSTNWLRRDQLEPSRGAHGGRHRAVNTITPNATVIAGGPAVAAGSDIGNIAGSQGAVLVTGAGSSWTNIGLLSVGTSGTGTLTIANGGVVSNGGASGFIAYTNGSQGTVIVTGPGSTWNISPTDPNGGLRVGGSSLSSGFLPPGPGTGSLTVANGGTVNVIGGAQTVFVAEPAGSTGTVNIGAASVAAAVAPGFINAANVLFGAGAASLNFNHTATDYVFAPVIGGNGAVNVISGRTILTASNTYTGPTTVNGGALIVNGSIASSTLTTVNGGGLLGGIGVVGNTQINTGGTFAPGPQNAPGSMAVQGNLAFQSGALYLVQVNPTAASIANVAGAATLAGTVQANFSAGSFVERSYTILTAAGGRVGTFDALTTVGLPANFQASLSYSGNTAVLNLQAQLAPPPGPPAPPTPGQPPAPPAPTLTVNQLNVANSIDNFFNNGGRLPASFVPLFSLTGGNLTHALDQLSGEAATGAQRVGFQLTDQFLNLMLDPFVDGRSGVGGADHPALGFAPERDSTPPEIALAYASVFKAPQKALPPVYEPRWTAWGGAYGGSNRTSGDLAVIGSHDVSARTVGVAGGLDYRLTPDTVVGFAFAGGGTDWSLSQGLGGGKSDAFQAGVYGATRSGPAYLAAAFAFANHWMSTDRFSFAGDHLTAKFNAQSIGGRLEGGYRLGWMFGGITPYAAIQAQSFRTPDYNETDVNGGGFGLGFAGRTATDTRSELGARFDNQMLLYPGAVLALRARLAWAHDWVSDPILAAAVPDASGRELHRQRCDAGTELRAGIGRRGASACQRRLAAQQIRRRVCIALIYLRRHGDDSL